jgi:transposase
MISSAGTTFLRCFTQVKNVPECGFVSKDNRKTQADFACTSCGHTYNADHNGAVNILARNEPLDANASRVTLCVV